jgi:Family of unknown function (DUF6152)
MKKLSIGAAVMLIACISGAAFAHHSAAGIDRTKTVTVEGVVKEFKWANPHSWLDVAVPNAKGGTDVWSFEMNPPAYLVRSGWKSTTVKSGDKIKVTANPFMNGDPGGIFVTVTLPDGQTLKAGASPSNVNQPPAK